MTLKARDVVTCPATGCTNTVEQKPGAGRRRLYCSDKCGAKFRKYQQGRSDDDNDAYALRLAEILAHRTEDLIALVREGHAVEALRTLTDALEDCSDLRAALVQQGYDRKVRPAEMCDATHVSRDTLGRWKDSNARRRRKRSPYAAPLQSPGEQSEQPGEPAPSPRHPRPATPPRQAAAHDLSADAPAAVFTRAIAQLHRDSTLTFTALGEAAGVDRSYIHRVVSGERTPSWKVTRLLAEACGADPDDLRPLWDAARGYRVARPTTLHAALRGMNLAAGRLTPDQLSARADGLTQDEITGLLTGTLPTDWPTVHRLVTAMGGHPGSVLPLWEAAYAPPLSTPPRPTPGTDPLAEFRRYTRSLFRMSG
ncbi:helix-turn-helix domain-containing protein [Streptomyces sp. NPDC055078]